VAISPTPVAELCDDRGRLASDLDTFDSLELCVAEQLHQPKEATSDR
jgi:hypothetical protein